MTFPDDWEHAVTNWSNFQNSASRNWLKWSFFRGSPIPMCRALQSSSLSNLPHKSITQLGILPSSGEKKERGGQTNPSRKLLLRQVKKTSQRSPIRSLFAPIQRFKSPIHLVPQHIKFPGVSTAPLRCECIQYPSKINQQHISTENNPP